METLKTEPIEILNNLALLSPSPEFYWAIVSKINIIKLWGYGDELKSNAYDSSGGQAIFDGWTL